MPKGNKALRNAGKKPKVVHLAHSEQIHNPSIIQTILMMTEKCKSVENGGENLNENIVTFFREISNDGANSSMGTG
jgi:uncharacterized protein YlzI (FlbEa/FlbD family)